MQGVPYLRKNQLKKSLERGSGESLSSERFPPINSISFYISTTVNVRPFSHISVVVGVDTEVFFKCKTACVDRIGHICAYIANMP